ncbi:hypothetical protein JZO70_21375 [Enterococcus sp. 669A]|uniref:PTS EIIB type-3 domain-containing protein n=1 Tax=Candidatus Enterococcus moelleringii TaxID=2815325 RepID=A0ABS3LGG1_9ENTE|nr:hypothetical protein [Enterococcus sp. 669A]MBO1308739.1 hypothetical protein [Enterococcus sp. 669A]
MKKICFVVYVSNGLHYQSITGAGHFSQIGVINALKKQLSPYYDVYFDPATMEEKPDLLVVPEPFKNYFANSEENILLLPGILFVAKDAKAIKEHIDDYFAEK